MASCPKFTLEQIITAVRALWSENGGTGGQYMTICHEELDHTGCDERATTN